MESTDVSWLQTTSAATTPSKSNPTPTDFLKLAQDNQLKAKYDSKIQKLQADLLQKERELEIFRITLDKTSKTQEYTNDLYQKQLKEELNDSEQLNGRLKSENKSLNTELSGLKTEMMVLGSEPVSEKVIDSLKKRGHQSVRQIAEIRLFEVMRPYLLEKKEQEKVVARLSDQLETLEQFRNENEGVYATAEAIKNQYKDQITRQRLEIVDARTRLTDSEHLVKEGQMLRVQNEENKRAIANLSHELAHSEEKFNHELNLRIKLEKELAVVGQQLTMTSSDKQFLERDRQDEKSKNHGLNLDLQTQWKELEQQRLQVQRAREQNAQNECKLLETVNRLDRNEKELLTTRRQLGEQNQTAREATLRAQHDTDLAHEKMVHLQNAKADFEEKLVKIEKDLYESRQDSTRLKNIYDKDVDLLETQLLEAQRSQESLEVDRLRAVAKVKEAAIDINTLQDQLQIMYKQSSKNSIENFDQNTIKSFNLADMNVPGIEDLEESVHNKPFATAIILAKRLHELYHDPEKANNTASNTKLRKQVALKSSNENRLRSDVQNLLQLGGQVGKMRILLKNLAAVDSDKGRIKELEYEYKKLGQFAPVNILE